MVGGLFRSRKKVEVVVEKKETPDELSSFETTLYTKIPDESIRDLVSSFLIHPSWIKEYDPAKKLEEAEQSEKIGRIGDAQLKYRTSALAAFYKKSELTEGCWKAYEDFLGRNKNMAQWHLKDIKAYKELKQKPDIIEILISTYEEFTKTQPEAGKR